MNHIETVLAFPRLGEIAAEPYEPRGILNSEMALAIAVCAAAGVEVVIESGRARAQSTYLLAKYLPDATIASVEARDDDDAQFGIDRMAGTANVILVHGDGAAMVPKLCAWNAGRRVAVLLDGPKGAAAMDVWDACQGAAIGFIHDLRRLDHGQPSKHRAEAERRYPGMFFTDYPDYVAAASWLDTAVVAVGEVVTGWRPGEVSKGGGAAWEPAGSYGPTLGMIVR